MDNLIELFFNEQGQFQMYFKLHTILLFLSIIVIFSKFWGANIQGIFVILVVIIALYISNLYVKINTTIKNTDLDDQNKSLLIKLQTLQSKMYDHIHKQIVLTTGTGLKLSRKDQLFLLSKNKLDAMYIDATLIYFLYSILTLYEYNNDEFYMLLKGTNNILKLRKEIEDYYLANKDIKFTYKQKLPSFRTYSIPKNEPKYLENLSEMFEIAIQLKTNCINNLQNIIYTVPKTNKMYTYIDQIIQRYTILINKNMDIFQKYNNDSIKANGINNRTRFINYTQTKGYDSLSNHPIIVGKKPLELQDLYV